MDFACYFDATERPRVMSWFSTAWVVPSLVGPPIAAFVTRLLSWHWVFFSVVPLLVLAVVVGGPAVARLPRSSLVGDHDPPASGMPPRPVPVWAAVVAALATAGLQWVGQSLAQPGLAATATVAIAATVSVIGLGITTSAVEAMHMPMPNPPTSQPTAESQTHPVQGTATRTARPATTAPVPSRRTWSRRRPRPRWDCTQAPVVQPTDPMG